MTQQADLEAIQAQRHEALQRLLSYAKQLEVKELIEEEKRRQEARTILAPRDEQDDQQRLRKLVLAATREEIVSLENRKWRGLAMTLLQRGRHKAQQRPRGMTARSVVFDDYQLISADGSSQLVSVPSDSSVSWKRPVKAGKKAKRRKK